MASPLVSVLKGKEGCDGVRLAVDYRYVNRFTRDVTYPLPDIVFQRIGRCNFVTVADCKAGYWQIPMSEDDKWLTAFVCDAGLFIFEFNRAPFGLNGSGNTFVRAMSVIQSSLSKFNGSFVDDVAVHSHQWKDHLDHLDRLLAVVKKHGLTLSLKIVSICSESSQILW